MSVTAEELGELLKRIVNVQTLDARLWDFADVAMFLKLNVVHVRKFIATRGDFPAPVDLPGAGSEPIRRYRAVDIRDWSEKFRR